MRYQISKSRNGNTLYYIARQGKAVVARATSEEALMKILSERDYNLKMVHSPKIEKIEKKLAKIDPKSQSSTDKVKRKILNNSLRAAVQEKTNSLASKGVTPKKSFWGKEAKS